MFLSTRFGHKIVLLEATLYRRAIENNYVEAGMAVTEYIRTKRRKQAIGSPSTTADTAPQKWRPSKVSRPGILLQWKSPHFLTAV